MPYCCIYVTDDPVSSKSSEEQMLMEDKLTYTGVVQRTEPSVLSLVSPTLSHLCPTRPFYLMVLPRRRGKGVDTDVELSQLTLVLTLGFFFLLTLPPA